jgi:hypothetical protein
LTELYCWRGFRPWANYIQDTIATLAIFQLETQT